jgi:hypothetical protein
LSFLLFVVCAVGCPRSLSSSLVICVRHLRLKRSFVIGVDLSSFLQSTYCLSSSRLRVLVIFHLRLLSSFVIFVRYLRSLSFLFVILLVCHLSSLSPVLFVTFLVCHLPRLSFLSFVTCVVCCPHSLSSFFVIFVCSVRSASIYRPLCRAQSKQ